MGIRVLHVVTYMGRGGLETMIMNYYRHIDRTKVQFDFLVHRNFQADYDEEILEAGGHIYQIPLLNPFSPGYYKALNSFFAEHHYDIVHSHLDCLSAYPLKAAKRYGVRTRIAHAHSSDQNHNLKYLIKIYSKRQIPRYATDFFASSKQAGEWMFPGQRFQVMKNAIDARQYIYNPETELRMKVKFGLQDKFVIGHVGRFSPPKNHSFLIDVFQWVQNIEKDAVLLLIGTGEDQAKAEAKVKKLGLQEKVLFLGSRADVSQVLQALDVFVFPSLYEGFGIAALEAQAAGLPCILSDRVPRECKLTENVEFLSLDLSPREWAERIIRYKGKPKENQFDVICNAGYDIEENAKQLENFYLSRG